MGREVERACVFKQSARQMALRRDFVAKTLAETTQAIENAIFSQRFAGVKGFLQLLDPRVKLVTFLALLIVTACVRRLEILVGFYVLTLALGLSARLPMKFFIKRVWVFIPIFTGIIALPAIFNIFTPGQNLFVVYRFAKPHQIGPFFIPAVIAVTHQGLYSAGLLVMRVATSVSLAVLLALTTEWVTLLKAMSVLKVPDIVILILAMTYRYIFLFLRVVEDMFLARKSRLIMHSNFQERRHWTAARIGVLVGKSYKLSNDVHLAMLSRGWTGKPRLMEEFRFSRWDWVWTGMVCLIITFWLWLR